MLDHVMHAAKRLVLAALCCSFLAGMALDVAAQQWPLTQLPPSALQDYQPADRVNAQFRGNPPFWSGTTVATITLAEPLQLVRFYNPEAGSNALGSWVMPAWEVRGLTAQQIRDKYALPSLPTHMELVGVPAGTTLYLGTAGPIQGWGNGGGLQLRINNIMLPESNYFNRQPLLGTALSYREASLGGDAARIGAVLDTIPLGEMSPWGQLADATSALDQLMTSSSTYLVGPSLDRLGPEAYELQTVIGERQAQLFEDSVARRLSARSELQRRATGREPQGEGTSAQHSRQPRQLWFEASGADLSRTGDNGGVAYHGQVGAVHVGGEASVSDSITLGLAGGFGRSWMDSNGDEATLTANHVSLGLYGLWLQDGWQARAGLLGSLALESMERDIAYPGVAASAQSSPKSTTMASHLALGYCFALEHFRLTPDAGLAWTWQHHQGFSEDDAGELALDVQGRDAHSMRGWANLKLEREFQLSDSVRMLPSLRLGWLWRGPLDKRDIKASFLQYAETMSVQGDHRARHGASVQATLRLYGDEPRDWRVQAEYEGEFFRDMWSHALSAQVAISF